ncbi:MAG: YdeI/OmpD-associated family protein [Ginsengibacter sp.]
MKTKFHTTILQAGKTATGIKVPEKIVESFKAGKKPPVRITINNYTYRNTIAVMGGVYMVGISAEHRKGANVAGGEGVNVYIELDTGPREVVVPEDFQKAINSNAVAKRNFEALSYSNKKAHISQIEGTKNADTRTRRIAKAIDLLGKNSK